jgi:uncharacterized protein (TIGR02996 family)
MPALLPHSRELQALLDAARYGSESDASRLILADWLDERDDPRGEMIRVSCATRTEEHNSPQSDAVKAQLSAWEKRWLPKWLGARKGAHIERGLLSLSGNAGQDPFRSFHDNFGPELTGWIESVSYWPCDDRTVADLTAWPWLPWLSLNGGDTLTDAGTAHLPQFTQLRSLSVSGGHLSDATLTSIARLQRLRALGLDLGEGSLCDGLPRLTELPALESLHLWGSWPGSERFAVVGRLADLRQLILVGLDGMPGEAFAMLTGLAALRHLYPGHRGRLTGSALADIAQLPSLQTLDVSLCRQVKNADVAHLARCSTLECLNLEDCGRLTDKCLEPIGKLSQLRTLNVGECKGIRGKGLASLAGLTRLEHLKLSGCRSLPDKALLPLRNLTNLRILRLRNCLLLTADGLSALAGLTRLRWLDLRECPQLSEADRKSLRRIWPECGITF